jgi:hypothetical protein
MNLPPNGFQRGEAVVSKLKMLHRNCSPVQNNYRNVARVIWLMLHINQKGNIHVKDRSTHQRIGYRIGQWRLRTGY